MIQKVYHQIHLTYIIYEVYNRPVVHPTLGWDASKSRNGAVHPMFEFLLSSSITCSDAEAVIFRIIDHENLKAEWKVELVETIQDYTSECPWDAND